MKTRNEILVNAMIKSGKLKPTMVNKISNKQIAIVDGIISVKENIKNTGGTTQIIKTSTLKSVGITDYMNGKLDENLNHTSDLVIVEFGSHATQVNPAKIVYSPLLSDAPASVVHAKLTMKQDGKVLFSESVKNVLQRVAKDGSNGQIGYLLTNPMTLAELSEITLELEYPTDVSTPADKEYFISFSLGGVKTTLA